MDTVEMKTGVKQASSRSKLGRFWTLSELSINDRLERLLFFGMTLAVLIISGICVTNALQWIGKPFAGFLVNKRMVVANLGQYHWSGIQAGLRYPDKIVAANGAVMRSVWDFEDLVQKTQIGEAIRYSVDRNGRVFEVTIPTMRFDWVDLVVTYGVAFLIGMFCFLTAVVVFILKPDAKASWAFLLAGFFLGSEYILSFDTVATHSGFIRLYFIVLTSVPAAAIHLSLVFPEQNRFVQKHRYLQLIPYIISIIIIIPLEFYYPGPMFVKLNTLVALYWRLGVCALLASVCLSYFKSPSVLARQRAKVVVFGTTVAFPIPTAVGLWGFFGGTLGGVAIQKNFVLIPLLAFPASLAYAIVKHNLFDVDVYIKRAVGYGIMTVVVGMVYLLMQTLTSTVILRPIFGEYGEKVYPIFFALFIVFFLNPINRKIQDGIDRIFFRKKFDYKETISKVSNALTSFLNLDQIINQVILTLRREMFIETAGVIVLELQQKAVQTFFIGDAPNNGENNLKDVQITYDDPLLALICKEEKLITKYDTEEDPRYMDVRESCGRSFSKMAASLVVPLVYQGEVTGVLALGDKKSGHFYTTEDIDLLNTMANQAAVAIANAKLFQENLEKGRMEEELRIAHDIQTSMLPDKAPKIEGFTIAAHSISAREVGGDFYDFIEMSGNGTEKRLAVVVGDVSGKAVSGALVMAASRSVFRVLADSHASVEEIMAIGNVRLNRDIKKGMFVALVYAVLDPQHKVLTLANAGQTQPIICRNDQSAPAYINTEGDRFPLGIVRRCKYLETHVLLQPGDTLVFYTDGVVEAMNDKEELYGFERFLASIEEGRSLGTEALLAKLMDDVSRYVGDAEPHDDLTIVVVQVE